MAQSVSASVNITFDTVIRGCEYVPISDSNESPDDLPDTADSIIVYQPDIGRNRNPHETKDDRTKTVFGRMSVVGTPVTNFY